MSRPDEGSAAHLSTAEQLSFVSARAVAAGQAYLRTRDRPALQRDARELNDQIFGLPCNAFRLPMFNYLRVFAETLTLAAQADGDKLKLLVLAIQVHERLVRLANRDQRGDGAPASGDGR